MIAERWGCLKKGGEFETCFSAERALQFSECGWRVQAFLKRTDAEMLDWLSAQKEISIDRSMSGEWSVWKSGALLSCVDEGMRAAVAAAMDHEEMTRAARETTDA